MYLIQLHKTALRTDYFPQVILIPKAGKTYRRNDILQTNQFITHYVKITRKITVKENRTNPEDQPILIP